MTGAQLTTRVLEQAGEIVQSTDTPVYYTEAQALAAINTANRLFVLLTLCLETTGSITISSSTNWYEALSTLPLWIAPLRMLRASDGVRVLPARLEDLDAFDESWQTATGTIERYACLGFDLLAVYKKPASGTVTLTATYAKSPAVLTSGGTPEIPEEYHHVLVDAAIPILRAKEGDGELAKVVGRFEVFMAAAEKLGAFVRKRNLAQRYDRMPFELAGYDRSKLIRIATRQRRAATPTPALDEAVGAKG